MYLSTALIPRFYVVCLVGARIWGYFKVKNHIKTILLPGDRTGIHILKLYLFCYCLSKYPPTQPHPQLVVSILCGGGQ